uniref:SWIM-type domain-containing protein n=1 Tax=Nicotiana tabacum TaxID=4097 RepID=A0A1S3Z8Q8_TOBAC|nr:PREDICTED: uncharacterized protein LOC107784273 [Nicotiana tabacum]
MLEEIRVKVMEMLANNEEKLRSWNGHFSPQCLRLYNDYRVVAQGCVVIFDGDYGYEIAEGEDTHTVNLDSKRCTCRLWELSGIPCPHAIKALTHKKVEPLTEINWFYSREAYLRTYRHKLFPVRGQKFWKIDHSQYMEPQKIMKLVGRPKVKRNREPDEARKRKGEWSASRKGLPVTCNKCGELNHNARRCYKDNFTEKASQQRKGKGCSQTQSQSSLFAYGPEVENEEDPLLRPMVVSETQTWLEPRKTNHVAPVARANTRKIQFRGDHIGASNPTNLPYSPIKCTWKGKEAMTLSQLQEEGRKKIIKSMGSKGKGALA